MVKSIYSNRLFIGVLIGIILIFIGGTYYLKHLDNEKTLEIERNIRLDYEDWHLPEGAYARIGRGTVHAMRYAPDGNSFAVVSDIGVWILDVQTAEPQHLLAAHTGVINSISFSADGSTLAVGTENGEAQLWDISTGKHQKTFTRRIYYTGVENVIFMPDGHTVAVIYLSMVDLWDIATGKRKKTLSEEVYDTTDDTTNNIPDMYMNLGGYNNSFSSDSKTVASYSNNGTCRIWDIATREEIHTLKAEPVGQYGELVSFSSDLLTVVTASQSNKGPRQIRVWEINLWDVNSGTRKKIFEKAGFLGFQFLVFSPDGNFFASLDDRAIRIWDVNTGKAKVIEYNSAVTSAAFSPDNRTLVSSSYDNTLRFWDVDSGKEKNTVTGYGALFRDVSLSSDAQTLMSLCFGSNTVRLWDTNTGQHINNFIADKKYFTDAVLSPDARGLAGSSILHNTIHLWDVNTGKHSKLKGPKRFVSGMAFSHDGKTLASWGVGGNRKSVIQFYEADRGSIQRTLQLSNQDRFSVPDDIYFDNKMLAGIVKFFDPTLFVWNLDSGDYKITDIGVYEVKVARFSPDGRMLAYVGKTLSQQELKMERNIVLRDVETGDHIRTFTGHTDEVRCLAFSPDSRTLASGSGIGMRKKTILLWDIDTGSSKVVMDPNWFENFRIHAGVASVLAFSADGQTLASGMKLGDIYLWKTATGEKEKTLHGHSQRISQIFFSADGKTLISASHDGTVLLWDLTVDTVN
ncbi:hypothetical protein F4212_16045 [Candidatus Poribacteria bacterium]|nr:hypothetical protein [Candidatus Poribacteria bacterium]